MKRTARTKRERERERERKRMQPRERVAIVTFITLLRCGEGCAMIKETVEERCVLVNRPSSI